MIERLTDDKGRCIEISTEYCEKQQEDCYTCKHGQAVFKMVHEYQSIGTVEQFAALVEQQKHIVERIESYRISPRIGKSDYGIGYIDGKISMLELLSCEAAEAAKGE